MASATHSVTVEKYETTSNHEICPPPKSTLRSSAGDTKRPISTPARASHGARNSPAASWSACPVIAATMIASRSPMPGSMVEKSTRTLTVPKTPSICPPAKSARSQTAGASRWSAMSVRPIASWATTRQAAASDAPSQRLSTYSPRETGRASRSWSVPDEMSWPMIPAPRKTANAWPV